jgi:ABC-2 type transport system permease protein
MYTVYKITLASIKMFLRNRQALFFSLFMPFIIMFIFGYIGFDKPPTIDIGLVTHSPTVATQAFVDQIKKFPSFTIHEGTLGDEQALLNQGTLSVVLEVPDNLVPGGTLTVYENAGQAGQAQTVVTVLNQFVSQATISEAHVTPIFSITEQQVNAHNLRYIEFLLPGLIALSIMQMSVFSVAFVFTQYKEKGVLKRLLATPMQPWQFVAANVITRLFVSLAQAAVFIIIGVLLFKVHVVGSYWLLTLAVLLGTLMFLGLGFTISGLSKTVDSVPAIANIVVFPMLFLGGTFFPISNMPWWLMDFAKILPLTYFSGAVRDIMTKGADFTDISFDLGIMLLWAIVLITLATITFSFQEKENA